MKSEIRKVEKRCNEEIEESLEKRPRSDSCKIVLKREMKGKNLDVEKWMVENFQGVKVRSVVEKEKGVFVLWLGSERDKRMMIEEKERKNRWRQFLTEEWLSPEECVRNAIEIGERLRKAKYGEGYR